MRRLLLLTVLVPACCWLFWASCQSDDYRDTLPLRNFDAAPREAGPLQSLDLATAVDLARPDQSTGEMSVSDGGLSDGGLSDGGLSDGAAVDGGG